LSAKFDEFCVNLESTSIRGSREKAKLLDEI
jgi:hypothetical protein